MEAEQIIAESPEARPWPVAAATAFTLVIAAATAIAALASHFWLADLLTHFRLQYAALAMASGGVLMCYRRKGWAAAAILVCVLNLALASPAMEWRLSSSLVASATSSAGAPAAIPVRVAAMNVYFRNRDHERALRFMREEKPDVAVLVEVTEAWREALRALEDEYPHSHYTGTPGSRGVLLLSRWPIVHAESPPLQRDVEQPVLATLRVRGRELRVLGVHATWPMAPQSYARRNRQLAELAELARAESAPLVIVGDLNVSPFSPHFETLLAAGGLRSATRGFGWQPTWPTFLPPAGIQIDHALVSHDLEVRGVRRAASIGSDHLPIVFDLAL